MKKFNLIALAIFLSITTLKGQFIASGVEEATQVKSAKLAVVLKEADERISKKLSKDPEKFKVYKDNIVTFNKLLKEAIEQEWTLSNDITYITKAEAEKIKDQKNPSYCLLEPIEKNNFKMSNYSNVDGSFSKWPLWSPGGSTAGIAIFSAKDPKKPIVTSLLAERILKISSLTFGVQNLQNQLINAINEDIVKISRLKKKVDSRTDKLKEKKLLLFDPLVSKALEKELGKNRMDKFYEYNFEKVEYEVVEKAIQEHDKNYAYIWVIPAGAEKANGVTISNYLIVDAENGQLLYMTGRGVTFSEGQFHQMHLLMANKEINK